MYTNIRILSETCKVLNNIKKEGGYNSQDDLISKMLFFFKENNLNPSVRFDGGVIATIKLMEENILKNIERQISIFKGIEKENLKPINSMIRDIHYLSKNNVSKNIIEEIKKEEEKIETITNTDIPKLESINLEKIKKLEEKLKQFDDNNKLLESSLKRYKDNYILQKNNIKKFLDTSSFEKSNFGNSYNFKSSLNKNEFELIKEQFESSL